jgi:hypothetical protein
LAQQSHLVRDLVDVLQLVLEVRAPQRHRCWSGDDGGSSLERRLLLMSLLFGHASRICGGDQFCSGAVALDFARLVSQQ